MTKVVLTLLLAHLLFVTSFAQTPPKRELRGAWIATVGNLDWPVRTQTPAQQRAALGSILDHHKATGINVLYIQIRSQCDAMYPSAIEPWSADLNGVQGRAPSPLWDPMQFAIDECHKRGIEFHAWINPYRAASNANNIPNFAANHVTKTHPEWLLSQGTERILNPGLPDVRSYISSVIVDILKRYDVDGIHFDDYFYPLPPPVNSGIARFNDDAAYAADPRGFTNRDDWRRDNINLFIKRIYDSVTTIKPWVKFGVSPTGIYRNSTNPAIGTATAGLEHYNSAYADTRKWLQQGWVDYIAPQVYWYMGQPGANYSVIVPWWNNNAAGRHIYIGLAGYKVNDPAQGTNWANPSQIPNEVRFNRNYANIHGEIFFRTQHMRNNPLGFRDSLRLNLYSKPALLPSMPWRDATPPEPATALRATKYKNDSVVLNWTEVSATSELDRAIHYVVYRSENPVIDLSNAANILAITNDTSAYNDKTIVAGKIYYYTVTAVDRFSNESIPSNAVADVAPAITCLPADHLIMDSSCVAYIPDFASAITAQPGTIVTQTPEAMTAISGTGQTTVTLTATNAVGQTATCSFTLDVVDVHPPVITPVDPALVNGASITLPTDAGTCSVAAGTAFDIQATDGCSGTLTSSYTITHNGVTSVPANGLSLAGHHFAKGSSTVIFKVSDASGNEATHSFTVVVEDREAPVFAACAADVTLSTDAGVCNAYVPITAPVATDNCGIQSLTGTRSDGKGWGVAFDKGVSTITWSAKDFAGNTTTCIQTITVEDREAPVITGVSVSDPVLFPPNHKMRNITLDYSVSDNCGAVTTTVTVTSNEAAEGLNPGDEGPDWEVINNHKVKLRAERWGSGSGRVYTITIMATDASGNVTTQTAEVLVPHDRSDITIRRKDGVAEEGTPVTLQANPNPSRNHFTLSLGSGSKEAVGIKVTDASGRTIERKSGIRPNTTLTIGAKYRPGVYYVEVIQGGVVQVVRLVKQ
jgi:uncharacterized lipoprotein YddW (UPF0748 family)